MHIAHYEKGYTYTTRELLLLAKKVGRMARYCEKVKDEGSLITVETLSRDTKKRRDSVKVVIMISLPYTTLRAESRRPQALDALDRCLEKLESQIEKYKARHGVTRRSPPFSSSGAS
jgi:ribosomal subunit interface protein